MSFNLCYTEFASSDHGLLPDAGMIEGRLFVSAWEAGLENVQNDIYPLIAHATEVSNIYSFVAHATEIVR